MSREDHFRNQMREVNPSMWVDFRHEFPLGTMCQGCGKRPATKVAEDADLCAECYYAIPVTFAPAEDEEDDVAENTK